MQTKSIKKFLQTMVNRILIRSKVLQIVYSFYQNGNGDLNIAEKELLFSLQKSYDLYHFLLLLIVDITHLQQRVIESRKNKLLPTEEDLHPNMKLANNRFAAQLEGNESLKKYVEERGISWSQDEDFIKSVLNTILKSDIYTEYISATTDDYETDKEFCQEKFLLLMAENQEPIPDFWERYRQMGTIAKPQFPVRGKDIIELGVSSSQAVGTILHELESRWLKSNFTLTKDELLENARLLYKVS